MDGYPKVNQACQSINVEDHKRDHWDMEDVEDVDMGGKGIQKCSCGFLSPCATHMQDAYRVVQQRVYTKRVSRAVHPAATLVDQYRL